LFGAAKIEKI